MALYRRVIRIQATDSPSVRIGLAQQRAGIEPTGMGADGRPVVPGVLPWHDFQKRLQTWDPVKQCIGLWGMFYEGGEVLLYPPQWLNESESVALTLSKHGRQATGMGVDPAEGGDNTAFVVVDYRGVLDLVSWKSVDTQQIVNRTIHLIDKWNLDPRQVCFDRGGGGYSHACQLRSKGYPVRTVAFGESVTPPIAKKKSIRRRKGEQEEKYPYKRRRDEMFGRLRERLDPSITNPVFAIPAEYHELRRQLAVFPLVYDGEGRMALPPKSRTGKVAKETKTLEELVGHSPDEADALALALYASSVPVRTVRIGRIFRSAKTLRDREE